MTIKASQSSLPGELLYSVKKISEGVQTTIVSDGGKAGLQAEFAGRRLEELNKITYDSSSSEEKTEKSGVVVNKFKDNLAQISQNVSMGSKDEIVAVALQTKRLEEKLEKTTGEISSEVKEIAEKAIDEAKSKILAALVEDGERNNDQENASSTDKEILIFLNDKTEIIIDENTEE